MINRNDMLDERSMPGIEVFQLTSEELPSSHVYMEAHVFTPDSRKFVLHRSSDPHGMTMNNPEHRYLLCDLENNGKLSPLTHEAGVCSPALSPDGTWFYYFLDETVYAKGGRITLKRVNLDGTKRETLLVIDGPVEGSKGVPSRVYPISTIRSDGQAICTGVALTDGKTDEPLFGALVIDLCDMTPRIILEEHAWMNLHPQYTRSTEPDFYRNIMVQHNHGTHYSADLSDRWFTGDRGVDIHIIRDDGSDMKDFPIGRESGGVYCQGHQCWRGTSRWVIASLIQRDTNPAVAPLYEACPLDDGGRHLGQMDPAGSYNDLSRSFAERPSFYHFATDISGELLVSDLYPFEPEIQGLVVCRLGTPGEDAIKNYNWLLNPRSSNGKMTHIHPFLSPDGKIAFFNSDESGCLQAYMVRFNSEIPD